MPFPRRRDALRFTEAERRRLVSISKSRSDEKRRTLRAAILLDSLSGQSDETIARQHHVSRGTVVLCIRKCLEFGLEAALGELPRPGKPRQLPDDLSLGFCIVLARSLRNWVIPTSCGLTSC